MNILRKIKLTRHLCNLQDVLQETSFYPNLPRKTWGQRLRENAAWLIRYHDVNSRYNEWGLDLQGVNPDDYYAEGYVQKTRDIMNGECGEHKLRHNYGVIGNDKFVFYALMLAANLPTPKVKALCIDGKAYLLPYLNSASLGQEAATTEQLQELFTGGQCYFCKVVDGLQGKLVRRVDDLKTLQALLQEWAGRRFIVQEEVKQHPFLNKIYSGSVNTIRVVTIKVGKEYELLGAALRCGNGTTGLVDNIHSGGGGIFIDDKGCLRKYAREFGFSHGSTTCHPDTGFIFENQQLPYYRETIALCCRSHRFFYGLDSVGWDVAITENGPTLLEANGLWGVPFMQDKDRGLKKRWAAHCATYGIKYE